MSKLVILALCCGTLLAQHQHSVGAPDEKPVILLPGLGIWKHPIATSNPEAQKYFDQGLVLMYGFNRYEALRSFRKALELDPHAGMAQWGIAMALGPYVNMDLDPSYKIKESCEAAEKGMQMEGVSKADRAWIAAAATRCPDFSDPSKYVAAMRAVATEFPDDPDAQTWYAESLMLPVRWRWYDNNGKAAPGVEEAEHVLQEVLRRFPDHPGANHFYIHAVESSPTPERAVPSAQKLMGIVPAAGHMVHMPGHIWLVLGNFDAAVDVNIRGAQVDREYFAKTGVTGDYYMYYLHNLQFILYARSMQGRVSDTRKAMADMQEAAKPMAKIMPEMADVFDVLVELTGIRIGQYDEMLAQSKPKSENPMTQAVWRYCRALSLVAKDRLPEAKVEREEFEKYRKASDAKIPWGNNLSGPVLELASAILEARTQPSPAASVDKWRRAVEIQDNLIYDEPPGWYYPVRESLGASLLLSGDAPGAEIVFREGARRSPNNGRMLFGLLESLKAQKKTDAAVWVERQFQIAWKGAALKLRLRDL